MFNGVFRHVRRQPVAFVALFFALGGGAMAANNFIRSGDTIPSGDLAGSTYGNPLIASGAVTNDKLANSSLTISAGPGLTGGGSVSLGGSATLGVDNGGIGTAQLANGSVTSAKLAAPTDGFTSAPGADTSLPDFQDTTVATLGPLSAGDYAVTAKSILIDASGSGGEVACFLFDNNNLLDVAQGSVPGFGVTSLVTQGVVSEISAVTFRLKCDPTSAGNASKPSIDAVRVASVNGS